MDQDLAILGDSHHNRADARLAARMISLGVVTPETAAKVLGSAFLLAAKAAKKGKARDYAAAMGVPLAAAKLELDREKLDIEKAKAPQQVNVNVDTSVEITVESLAEARKKVADWRQDRFKTQPIAESNGHAGTNGTANGIAGSNGVADESP